MELLFNAENGIYSSEFQVDTDFNLHLERKKKAPILILLKTSGEHFADTEFFKDAGEIFDYDFIGFVYPKTIKIISYIPINKGYVTYANY